MHALYALRDKKERGVLVQVLGQTNGERGKMCPAYATRDYMAIIYTRCITHVCWYVGRRQLCLYVTHSPVISMSF